MCPAAGWWNVTPCTADSPHNHTNMLKHQVLFTDVLVQTQVPKHLRGTGIIDLLHTESTLRLDSPRGIKVPVFILSRQIVPLVCVVLSLSGKRVTLILFMQEAKCGKGGAFAAATSATSSPADRARLCSGTDVIGEQSLFQISVLPPPPSPSPTPWRPDQHQPSVASFKRKWAGYLSYLLSAGTEVFSLWQGQYWRSQSVNVQWFSLQ